MVALDLNQIIQKLVDITKEYGALFQVCVCGWMNGWACICFCGCGCVRVYVRVCQWGVCVYMFVCLVSGLCG